MVDPLRDEEDSLVEIVDPGREWLQRKEAYLTESAWDLVIEQGGSELV